MEHPKVKEVAVVGIEDERLGEEIGAIVVLHGKASLDEIETYSTQILSSYKIPRKWMLMEGEIPKNSMGKVNKKELKTLFL